MIRRSLRPFCLALILLLLAIELGAQEMHMLAGSLHNGVRFTENRGQIVDTRGLRRPDLLFTASTGDVSLYFRKNGISYVFTAAEKAGSLPHTMMLARTATTDTTTRVTRYRMDMELVGANPHAAVIGEEQRNEIFNYYLGHSPEGITGVRSYRRLIYREIYPKIDLLFHGDERGMKYDFIVHPGGQVEDIRMRYIASGSLELNNDGALTVHNPVGWLKEGTPLVYSSAVSEATGRTVRREIPGRYQIDGDVVTFAVGAHDREQTLVIDPSLEWMTYFGGSDQWAYGGTDIAVDSFDNVCIVGSTASHDFVVTPGAYQPTLSGNTDIFAAKFDRTGALLWSTFYGGSWVDWGKCIAIDPNGDIVISGSTRSENFPVSELAFQSNLTDWSGGEGVGYDAFLVKLSPAGRRVWGTYYGGDGTDEVVSVAVGLDGGIVLAGSTRSHGLATPGAFQVSRAGGTDVLLARFSRAGARLWMTYYGGDGEGTAGDGTPLGRSVGNGVAVDRSGNIYVTGQTSCVDFPVTRTTRFGGSQDAFILKFDANGTRHWGTYIGGNRVDNGVDIVTDPHGNVIVAGTTESNDFGFPGTPFQPLLLGESDCFVMQFGSDGERRWGTYMGGRGNEWAAGISVSRDAHVTVVATTTSSDFPISANAFQPTGAATLPTMTDAVLFSLDSIGRRRWGTYIGGERDDVGNSVASLTSGIAVSGGTASPDLPITTNAHQRMIRGEKNVFLARLCDMNPIVAANRSLRFCEGDSVVLDVQRLYSHVVWSTGETTRQITVKTSGRYWVAAGDDGCIGTSDTIDVVVGPTTRPSVMVAAGSVPLCEGDSVVLSSRDLYSGYRWATGDTGRSIVVREAGQFHFQALDASGCWGRSDTIAVTIVPRPKLDITGNGTLCAGDSVLLDAGGPFNRYEWSTGERTRTITVKNAGVYTVTVNAICTTLTDSVRVDLRPSPQPSIMALGPLTFCEGENVSVSTTEGYLEYTWSHGATARSVVLSEPGIYTVSVLDANGCRGVSLPIEVEVLPRPRPVITADRQLAICDGAGVTLDAGAGYTTYRWSTGEVSQTITVSAAGRYSVTVVGADGCEGISEPVDVTMLTIPDVLITPPGEIMLCAGDSIILRASPGHRAYRWSRGDTTGEIVVRSAGIYTVTVVDVNGCEVLSDETTVQVLPEPEPPTIGIRGDTLSAPPAIGYQWSRDGADLSGETSRQLVARDSGIYRVAITDASGCRAISDPILYAGPGVPPARRLWLDTLNATVGEEIHLRARVEPPLTASDSVTGYRVMLRMSPRALHPLRVVAPAGAAPEMRWERDGSLIVESTGGGAVVDDELFSVVMIGLVTGQPVNVVAVEHVELDKLSGIGMGDGLIFLSGCDVGMALEKKVEIRALRPQPVADRMEIVYRAPAGSEPDLIVHDLAGRRVSGMQLPISTGDEQLVAVDVRELASGIYQVELRDRAERSILMVTILK